MTAAAIAGTAASGGPFPSDSGRYRIDYRSQLDPIPINQIHAWTLHLSRADGQPVDGAELTVTGGMPAHDHGLPTAPQVTRALGGGDYRLEGLRFHMNGYWELTVNIRVDGARDTATLTLRL